MGSVNLQRAVLASKGTPQKHGVFFGAGGLSQTESESVSVSLKFLVPLRDGKTLSPMMPTKQYLSTFYGLKIFDKHLHPCESPSHGLDFLHNF